MDHSLDEFVGTNFLELTEDEKTAIDNRLYFTFVKAFSDMFSKHEISMGIDIPKDLETRELLKDQHHVFCKFPKVSLRDADKNLIEVSGVNVFIHKETGTINGKKYCGFCYDISIQPIGKIRHYRCKTFQNLHNGFDYDSNLLHLDLSFIDDFWVKMMYYTN